MTIQKPTWDELKAQAKVLVAEREFGDERSALRALAMQHGMSRLPERLKNAPSLYPHTTAAD